MSLRRSTPTRRLTAMATRAVALLAASTLALLAAGLMAGNPADARAATGVVYLLQGMPNRNVDLYSNGTKVGSNIAPKTVVGPMTVAAGTVNITVTNVGSTTPLVQRSVTVAAGQSVDAVTHLSAAATPLPLLTVFVNDLSPVTGGKVRLAVAHTADVPAADIRVDGKVLFSNVANGEGLTTVVPAGSYSVEIVPTGTTGPAVLGPATVDVAAGTLTRVFAIGQPASNSMDAIVQVLKVAPTGSLTTPAGVNTGSGGRAAFSFAPHLLAAIGLLSLGCTLLAGAAWAVTGRRRAVLD